MSVILTSFKTSDRILSAFPYTKGFSVARTQPKGYVYPELKFLMPYDVEGNPIHMAPSRQPGFLVDYKMKYLDYLEKNGEQLDAWMETLNNEEDIMLCCWCPHTTRARDDLRVYSTFACHTGIIGQYLNIMKPDLKLYMDLDHAVGLAEYYKPQYFTVIDL